MVWSSREQRVLPHRSGREVAGKTGTVDDFTDAWFVGYTPSAACGVWIGYSDKKKPLGKR